MVKNRRLEDEVGCLGIRHLQIFLIFCGLMILFALRVNLSVAIVAMTDKNSTNPDFEEFDWDEKTKSWVLSSFFCGYVITQVPGGYLSSRFGAKYLLFFGIFICSLLNTLTPWFTSFGGWKFLCACRLLQGLSQGVVFPSTHTFLSKWVPVEERGRLATYAYSGTPFGTVIMLATSGIIASSAMGWPGIFYLSGASGLIWSVVWLILGASTPSESRLISDPERNLIETSLGQSAESHKVHMPTPWLSIFKSLPVYSLLIVHCTNNWGFWTILAEMPTYIKSILGMDIKSNALLSSLPYFANSILSFVFCFISLFLSKYELISTNVSRKLFNTIGHWIPMVALVALGYVTKGQTAWAIILLTIAVGSNGAIHLGFQVNHIDLAPNYAGILLGMTNSVANFMGVLAPLAVGFIITDEQDPMQWRTVFFIAAGLYLIGNAIFIVFGTTDIQPWNTPATHADMEKNTEAVQEEDEEEESRRNSVEAIR